MLDLDSHWINVGLPLDWISKFNPTNHRTRAPANSYNPRALTGNVIGSYAILVLACPIKQVFNRREEEGRRARGGQ